MLSIQPVEAKRLHFKLAEGVQQKSIAAKLRAEQMIQNKQLHPQCEPIIGWLVSSNTLQELDGVNQISRSRAITFSRWQMGNNKSKQHKN